jgi:hypothetical protein
MHQHRQQAKQRDSWCGNRLRRRNPSPWRSHINRKNQMNEQQLTAVKQAVEALKRMKRYGDSFAYRSSEQNPYEQVCEAITALQSIISQEALDKKAENARELGLTYEQQPTGTQSLQVAPSIVDAYCAAWEQSFLADNPFDTVHLTDALKKHVEAGLKAALAKAIGETK